jgi:glutamine amidotransferase
VAQSVTPDIAIIDYGMGNLRSVEKALERVGANARIVASPDEAFGAQALVLPGVGAFAQAMERLSESEFDDLVRAWASDDRPFLGICLGLQILFTESEEPKGEDPGLKVPHMGWNRLEVTKPHAVTAGIPEDAMAYFVHSYYCVPDDPDWTAVATDHGIRFTSAVARGNLFASQFHPEKSGDVGLKMLANFVGLVRRESGGGA